MIIELYFYYFCTQYLGNAKYLNEMMVKIKLGINKLIFKAWKAVLRSKRYSGEMDTSSMNGLFNYLLIRFLNFKSGETHTIPPTLEGDDSLNGYFGTLDETILVRLGAMAKLEYFDDVFAASFCGMVFNEHSKQIITDPIKALLNFGFSNQFYVKSNSHKLNCLLRAKSLSMLHTFPACPILSALAKYGLRVTPLCSNRDMVKYFTRGDVYLREKFVSVLASCPSHVEPTLETRLLFQSKYGFSVEQQHSVESYLDGLSQKSILSHPDIDMFVNPHQSHFFEHYCHNIGLSEFYFM